MNLFKDDMAENPIEVLLYLFVVLLVMAFLMIVVGAFLDEFQYEVGILTLANPLSSWGTGVMAKYMAYINYAYAIPSIFIIIVLIWGVRAVIRRHSYTSAQDQTYNNPDEF